MKSLEDLLNNEKSALDKIEVPIDLEDRLKTALNKPSVKQKRFKNWKIPIAAAIVIFILIGSYNFDTLAFYGKKIIGYDDVMDNTLKNLNNLGMGQPIGKTVTFKDGATITLDGIILDDNQLVALHTGKVPKGDIDKYNLTPPTVETDKGQILLGNSYGLYGKNKTSCKWIMYYDNPPTSGNITFLFNPPQGGNSLKIPVTIDKNKAMGHTLKCRINESVEVDDGKIHFNSIIASPICTIIKGSIQNVFQLALATLTNHRLRPTSVNYELIANGKSMNVLSSGLSTSYDGITFDTKFSPLPKNLNNLQIKFISFNADHDVDETIALDKTKSAKILDRNITINNIDKTDKKTYITITTEQSVVLTKVYLLSYDKKINLVKTKPVKKYKIANGTTLYTRTLEFDGTGNDLKLKVKRLTYEKAYNKVIDIPVK